MLPLSCILLNFYIKPQQQFSSFIAARGCILLNFYIKPQHPGNPITMAKCCILLNFYIKPQQKFDYIAYLTVVSY